MNRNFRDYLWFYVAIGFFVFILIFLIFIYTAWDDEVEAQGVEVNLPIIEWGKYLDLSKQYENGIL